jgi:hypothetical protein
MNRRRIEGVVAADPLTASRLTIAWFQEAFALPIDATVRSDTKDRLVATRRGLRNLEKVKGMPVERMVTDEWQGVRNREHELSSPPLEAIEKAVIALDASVRTLVVLELGQGPAHMAVGGGGGRYVVYVTNDNDHFAQLTDDSDDNTAVLLRAGGQEGEYAKRFVVGVDAALQAVRHYAREGEADPSLRWTMK